MSPATLPLRVVRKWNETPEICGFELRARDGAALPPFTAGAHIDVHIPGGVVRQYSLCNTPLDRSRYVIGVLREPTSRGGSIAMHERVSEGDSLHVSLPRNLFPLFPDAQRHFLFAGGIGLTPLMSMAEQLLADRADFELHVSARTRSRLPFAERLLQPSMARHVRLHFDDGAADQRLDLDNVLQNASPQSHLYVCGPKGYIDWVLGEAARVSWAAERLHKEHFSNALSAAQAADAGAFELLLARSGRLVPVSECVRAQLRGIACSVAGQPTRQGVQRGWLAPVHRPRGPPPRASDAVVGKQCVRNIRTGVHPARIGRRRWRRPVLSRCRGHVEAAAGCGGRGHDRGGRALRGITGLSATRSLCRLEHRRSSR